jgi:IS4 transposase
VKPIRWLLLTTLPVNSLEDTLTCLNYYSQRWSIERYHYALKSGCQIEETQLENAERIKRAFVTYSLAAWRLLWLTYLARVEPELSCEVFLLHFSYL